MTTRLTKKREAEIRDELWDGHGYRDAHLHARDILAELDATRAELEAANRRLAALAGAPGAHRIEAAGKWLPAKKKTTKRRTKR